MKLISCSRCGILSFLSHNYDPVIQTESSRTQRLILTSEDIPCSQPEALLAQFVKKHLQHCVVHWQFFGQHEDDGVGSDRKYLSVHTHLQVSVKQMTIPGDVYQAWRKKEKGGI